MTIKGSACSALILATGVFVCFAGPSLAAAGADNAAASQKSETAGAPIVLGKYAKHGTRHLTTSAHRKSVKVAAKPSADNAKSAADKKTDAPEIAADDGDHSSAPSALALPPWVANANAQLASADAPTDKAQEKAQAMTARASGILQAAPDQPAEAQPAVDTQAQPVADTQIVSADQLNDVDRALHKSSPPASALPAATATTLAMASADAPAAASAAPVAAGSTENSAWDQTSLIGKIFIGFGALLTMASAARMFMA